MKRLIVLAALLLAGGVHAQTPVEVATPDLISVGVGQAKVFKFEKSFGRVEFMPKDIADAVPQSDKQLSIVGIKTGASHMFVFSPDGAQIYSADVTVAPEPGRLVKVYGTASKDETFDSGFVAVYCDEFGCGRPDKDLARPAVSVERIIRDRR